ncbi:MAG: hypothetical protein KBD51_03625 [Candidatus Levybacteria bacterium]|nr:hypothetical protein [Candidatus Levybacteria bacterium]
MTDYKRRIGTAIATVAILANAATPAAFAGTTISITNNGADSDSDVQVNNTQNTNVTQNNTANFTNNIDGDANTGDNDANKNNGGNVTVNTGDASINATVVNQANTNNYSGDCCTQGDTEVKIGGNAANSNNTANLDVDNNIDVDQDNRADFENNVKYLDAKTGNNDANKNNGGDVSIETGDASVKVAVSNWANANSARVGGGNGDEASMSLKILNNAADSDNDIIVDVYSDVEVDQDNDADFDNRIDGDSNTGDNDAKKNNGGEVSIETGDASVDVTVDNMANFNWADLNCGCVFGEGGLTVDVSGNAYNSDNNVNGDFDSKQDVDQDNDAEFDTNVKNSDAETGNNDANKNNAGAGEDPSIETGDADVNVGVANSANMNSVGSEEPEWPGLDLGGVNINISFDLGDLMDALGL